MKKILSISVLLLIANSTTFGQQLINTTRSNIKHATVAKTTDTTIKKDAKAKSAVHAPRDLATGQASGKRQH